MASRKSLKKHLELESLFGADFLPISKKALSASPPAAPRPASVPPPPSTREKELNAWEKDWPADYLSFRAEALGCTKCGLCSSRTQVVFGTGPLTTPLLFVGEAPGEDEDRKGEPFVGRAGQLLTTTLQKLGIERRRVHIANILKCRPPGNRTPQPEEMAACMPWLTRQIQAIRPRILVGLGNVAVQTLLSTKTGITKLRGKTQGAHGTTVFPTFHPAYVLRNMGELPQFEADVKQAVALSGLKA